MLIAGKSFYEKREKMRKLENVFFRPWVGKNYEEGIGGKKILILGESHICGYCEKCGDLSLEDESCRDFTKLNCMDSYLSYNRGETPPSNWHRTFTKYANVFHNRKLNSEEMESFWESVLFYNYVQYSTSESRTSPTDEEFSKSETAFFEVLKKFKPGLILVWGVRLWNQMPSNGEWSERVVNNNPSERVYLYKVDDALIPAYATYHPSAGFGYNWYEYIEDFRINSEKF